MPVLVYALFGSSRELAVGPVAVTSLLISSSLKVLVPGADEIINPNNPAPDMVGSRMTVLAGHAWSQVYAHHGLSVVRVQAGHRSGLCSRLWFCSWEVVAVLNVLLHLTPSSKGESALNNPP